MNKVKKYKHKGSGLIVEKKILQKTIRMDLHGVQKKCNYISFYIAHLFSCAVGQCAMTVGQLKCVKEFLISITFLRKNFGSFQQT